MQPQLYDFAIAGLGPVGAVLACLLGQSNKSVLVLESTSEPYDKPRAIGIDHESMRILQFCKVAHAFAPQTHPFQGTSYLGLDGAPFRRLTPVQPPYALGWPPNASFVQPELETLLRSQIGRLPAIDVRLQHTLHGIEQTPSSVLLTVLDHTSGQETKFRARYLIGCDGARSFVRRHMGATFDDLSFDEWWVVVDAWVKDQTRIPPTGRHYCWPTRPASFVLGPGLLRRWELKVLPHERPEDFESRARIIDIMRPYVDPDAIDIWRSAVYRFHAVVCRKWRDDRIFLAGDAAHQTPPFLGQGMNSGFRDAANLAWKLLAVERGADDRLLDTYEQERKPHFETLVRHAKDFGLIIGELDEASARKRDIDLRAEMNSNLAPVVRQKFIPVLTSGLIHRTQDGHHPYPAGELFVQPRILYEGKPVLLDDIVGMQFLLVTSTPDSQTWLNAEECAWWSEVGGLRLSIAEHQRDGASTKDILVFREDNPRLFGEWMDQHAFQAVIVRPDRYIFSAARTRLELKAAFTDLRLRLPLQTRAAA